MNPVNPPTWTLTVTDRRLMWLQKQHPGVRGQNSSSGHPELSRVPHARRRPKWIIH